MENLHIVILLWKIFLSLKIISNTFMRIGRASTFRGWLARKKYSRSARHLVHLVVYIYYWTSWKIQIVIFIRPIYYLDHHTQSRSQAVRTEIQRKCWKFRNVWMIDERKEPSENHNSLSGGGEVGWETPTLTPGSSSLISLEPARTTL